MRRRKQIVEGARSTLGDYQLAEGCGELDRMCQKTVAQMVDYKYSVEGLLRALFEDETMDKLRAVRGMITPASGVEGYLVAPDATLFIHFADATVPTITPGTVRVNAERAAPLLKAIAEIKVIHEQFEVCKHVLRWLNKNATPGAMRYYFPGAMKLCPRSPVLMELQNSPVRFSTPIGISDQLSLIREAGNTIASAVLLPKDATTKVRGKAWLTITPYHLRRHTFADEPHRDIGVGPTFTTDVITYNLG